MNHIYDLSTPLESSPSELGPVTIEHISHESSLPVIESLLGGNGTADGKGWADDRCSISAHSGTHVDAPWHYSPISEKRKARTIDEMPLDWFYHDGVVLDLRKTPSGSGITIDNLKSALKAIKYSLKPWDIVLIQTGVDKLWGKPQYLTAGCGMTEKSTLWLVEQGCRVMGIDAWGWDRPFASIKEEYNKTGNSRIIWAAHKAGIQKEYCHIEKLANLDKLPRPYGFKVSCFPVKITGGSAGWSRVVAIFEE